jgi:RNA polymerase sigma-70 factor (ECF subfamily)
MEEAMTRQGSDTDQLLEQAKSGDRQARQALLARHRDRLGRMVAVRMDRRLAARADPSDVVQEVLLDAHQQLSDYLRQRPLPFYPWLRQLAWDRLIDLHRRHISAKKRSVVREEQRALPLPDESALDLARRLTGGTSAPSRQALRTEMHSRMFQALAALAERDREILAMRHLEQMSIRDMAAVLGVTEGTVKTRHLRALQRLRGLLGDDFMEDVP